MNSNMFTENSILAMNEAKFSSKVSTTIDKAKMLAYALLENKEGLIPKSAGKNGLEYSFYLSRIGT